MHWCFSKAGLKVFPLRTVIVFFLLFFFFVPTQYRVFSHSQEIIPCTCIAGEISRTFSVDLRKWTWSRSSTCFKVRIKLRFRYRLYYMQCSVLDISVLGIDLENFLYANILETGRCHVALRFFFFKFAINYILCKSYHVNISFEAARVDFHSEN